METANVTGGAWYPNKAETRQTSVGDGHCTFLTSLEMDIETTQKYGAPAAVIVNVTVPGSDGAAANIELKWFEKTATRIA